MARKTWPQGKCEFVVGLVLVKLVVFFFVFCGGYVGGSDGEVGKFESNPGGSDLILENVKEYDRVKREVIYSNQSVSQVSNQNDSYLLNYSNSTFHKRRKKGKKWKKLRGEKFRNGTRRKKKKKNFIPVVRLENKSERIQLPFSSENHVINITATPKPVSVIEKSTIIRTSEGDDPRNRLLIETVRTNSKPEVRYYPNYPLHWEEGSLKPQVGSCAAAEETKCDGENLHTTATSGKKGICLRE